MQRPESRLPRVIRRAAFALLLLGGTAACRSESAGEPAFAEPSMKKIGDIQWYVDYDEAAAVAREQNKALWVHFGEDPG